MHSLQLFLSPARSVVLAVLPALLWASPCLVLAAKPTRGDATGSDGAAMKPASLGASVIHFNRDIRPLLAEKCFACHGPGDQQAGMRLDTYEGATEWAIVPGDAAGSEVIARITSDDPDLQMPPPEAKKEPVTEAEIARLKQWIIGGAEYEPHWAYLKPEKRQPPKTDGEAWDRNPIDSFILAKLNEARLSPAPEADKVTLARRLYFDVIGLPPTTAELDEFLLDSRPDAYEKLVDKLLASPRYGERMATWWFDLIRFSNTVGYHGDQTHNILPFRDYVIKSLNENLPFDQFTIEQLAGDLLPPSGDAAVDMWRKIASGYNRILQSTHEGGAQDGEYRAKMLADRVRNVSETWLGSSMGCAECHDHKFDPITTKDFYAMEAFFADVDQFGSFEKVSQNSLPTIRPPEMLAWTLPLYKKIAAVDKQIATIEKKLAGNVPKEYQKLQKSLADLKKQRADLEAQFVPTMVTRAVEPREIRILPRGDWMDDSGEVVAPNPPEFLVGEPPTDRRLNRLDLAKWIVSKENPLTARVTANRLWKLYFGRGFSKELVDVGSQSEWPTHPELLDWLAVEFVDSGWDLKQLVRTLVTSSAYRQSSMGGEVESGDPENKLLARQGRYRLEAEQIRDAALQISGLLVNQVGGEYAKPYQPVGYYAQLNFPQRKYKPSKGAGQRRRAVYTHWQRQYLHPWLLAFDAPTREECTARRPISNTPSAALVLLNDPSFVEAARVFAARALSEPKIEAGSTADEQRVRWAWREATGREPLSSEVEVVTALLEKHRKQFEGDVAAAQALLSTGDAPRSEELEPVELAAWTSVCRTLFNLSETITRN